MKIFVQTNVSLHEKTEMFFVHEKFIGTNLILITYIFVDSTYIQNFFIVILILNATFWLLLVVLRVRHSFWIFLFWSLISDSIAIAVSYCLMPLQTGRQIYIYSCLRLIDGPRASVFFSTQLTDLSVVVILLQVLNAFCP